MITLYLFFSTIIFIGFLTFVNDSQKLTAGTVLEILAYSYFPVINLIIAYYLADYKVNQD